MENIQLVVNNGIDPFNLSGGIGLSEQDVFSTIVDKNPTQNSAMTSGVESLAIPSIPASAEVFSDGILSNTLDSSFRLITANALSNNPDIDSLTGTKNNQSIVSELNTDPLINPHNLNSANSPPTPLFESGVFTVGETGQVNIDFLFDAGGYQGELAIFSLAGIEAFELGSTAFIQEAARRALSNSELGHVVISDRTEGSKFSGVLGEHESRDWGAGDYLGVKTFAMRPGDEFGFMLIPNGKVQQVFNNPNIGGAKSPVFSMATSDQNDSFDAKKIADITGDSNTFGMEDLWINGKPDYDYNDIIFQVKGATGNAVLVDDVIDPKKDWRNSQPGQQLIQFAVEPLDLAGNTPDTALKSLPSTTGKTYRGWVGSTDTDDYYSFSLGMSNEFNLSLDGLRGDANVQVLDFNNNIVYSSANTGTTPESINGLLEAGAYRVRVSSVGDFGTAYNLNLAVKPTIEGITTGGSEAPVYLATNVSGPLINMDDFRSGSSWRGSRPEFAGIDGTGFSTVILDTGIDLDHPFFGPDNNGDGIADRIVFNFDFADNDHDGTAADIPLSGHGSNVSSIVASQDATFTGMAPGANIIALKVFEENTNPATMQNQPALGVHGTVEQALQWVVANAERFNIASVNLSLGDQGNYNSRDSEEYQEAVRNTHYADELAALAARGVIVVSAAGNRFFDHGSQQGVAYPAADPNTIAVGAVWDSNRGASNWASGATDNTTNADRIASFSQRDATLTDIFAPGAQIEGAGPDGHPDLSANGTIGMSGTSQAAPHIAGMAVLAQQLAQQELNRQLTPAEFRRLIHDTGTWIFDGDENGNGIVDGNEEDDNVQNTGLWFRRADMLGLANGIMDLRPFYDRDIDLSAAWFDVVQPTLNTGDNFNVNSQIQNTQPDNAGLFYANFYLSENNVISSSDFLLGTFPVTSLRGNSNTGLLTQTLTLPAQDNPIWRGFGNGQNSYIGMIVDPFNMVGETNENNNSNTWWRTDYDNFVINNIPIIQQGVVTVTINRAKGDFDPWLNDSDFYTKISINGNEWRSPTIGGRNDISPNWYFPQWVTGSSISGATVPITIKLYDSDGPQWINRDEHVDIDPNWGDKDLNLFYNLFTKQITGDLFGNSGDQIYSRGAGDSDRGEIWFTIDFG